MFDLVIVVLIVAFVIGCMCSSDTIDFVGGIIALLFISCLFVAATSGAVVLFKMAFLGGV